MGYYITIEECELNGSLEELDIDDLWVEDEKTHDISVKSNYMKWYDWFEDDLKTMSAAGVKGYIHVRGEEGEHEKYHLDGAGTVSVFEGKVVFDEIPNRLIPGSVPPEWKKTQDDGQTLQWRYDAPGQSENVPHQHMTVTVSKIGDINYGLQVILTTGKAALPFINKSYKTRAEAVRHAIEQMKGHGRST